MKILHITTDNKFLSHAMQSFENTYPGQNTVWMLNQHGEINNGKNSYPAFSPSQRWNPLFISRLNQFDLVVLHSLTMTWYPLVFFASKKVKFAWIGWGFDYYGYIYRQQSDLLLAKTLIIESKTKPVIKYRWLKRIIKTIPKLFVTYIVIPNVLKKISSFSPVLEQDYILLKKANIIPSLPSFIAWNYGSLEEVLVKDFIGQRITGKNILIGNSATATNNHIEVFDLIKSVCTSSNKNYKVLVPLSYGSESYKNEILKLGESLLGKDFSPIVDFMPIDKYILLIRQCGFVIMNHKRQQAVGNIVIMLYLGARVFLREENPTYIFLKAEGVVVNSVQEIEKRPILLKTPLTETEIQKNIEVLYKHWSKKVIDDKTRGLVEFHCNEMA